MIKNVSEIWSKELWSITKCPSIKWLPSTSYKEHLFHKKLHSPVNLAGCRKPVQKRTYNISYIQVWVTFGRVRNFFCQNELSAVEVMTVTSSPAVYAWVEQNIPGISKVVSGRFQNKKRITHYNARYPMLEFFYTRHCKDIQMRTGVRSAAGLTPGCSLYFRS